MFDHVDVAKQSLVVGYHWLVLEELMFDQEQLRDQVEISSIQVLYVVGFHLVARREKQNPR